MPTITNTHHQPCTHFNLYVPPLSPGPQMQKKINLLLINAPNPEEGLTSVTKFSLAAQKKTNLI